VNVENAQGPHYLVIGQNFDRHWKASIDGRDLGPPLLLDGYSAGWRIDRTGTYTVSVRYGQQRVYAFALLLSAVTVIIALGSIGKGLLRRRRLSRLGGDPGRR
jgi:arabinofuranan 3-O-arabinosyltransferase